MEVFLGYAKTVMSITRSGRDVKLVTEYMSLELMREICVGEKTIFALRNKNNRVTMD